MFSMLIDLILLFACTVGVIKTFGEAPILAAMLITAGLANLLKLNYDMKKHYKKIDW